jgi:hypothetical protein
MKASAAIANSLWIASSFGAWRRFQHALQHPAPVQQQWLQRHLACNANSAFAREHKLSAVRSYKEFTRRVPLQDYNSIEPLIECIRSGETNVLTSDRVTHLIPTSGSTGARKLIPFTAGLQRDFDRAIAAWICDLARQHPGILGGPAYWSISPAVPATNEPSAVPIGFADDASYIGGVKGWLVRATLVTPYEPLRADNLDAFHRATLLALLSESDLRLISVWHPSFLTLLLDALPTHWNALLTDIARKNSRRTRELECADPRQPETFWPHLRVISCWGDAHAEFGFAELRQRFPNTPHQRKGLLATEAFVTIPFAGKHPLAIGSHFFEFADESGHICLAHELRAGETYEVIVTTSGGLWRYRLGDLVRVAGFVNATPALQFLGRSGNISDLCGEKLSEPFVATAIQRVAAALGQPTFAMLAPEIRDHASARYILFLRGKSSVELWRTLLETELRRNPHYDYCRRLGQLGELEVRNVGPDACEIVLRHEVATGKRPGEIKTSYLSKRPNWAEVFGNGLTSSRDQRPIQPPSMFSTAPLR